MATIPINGIENSILIVDDHFDRPLFVQDWESAFSDASRLLSRLSARLVPVSLATELAFCI